MRDWLFVLGGLLIVVIIADAVRRMWVARRTSVRMQLETEGEDPTIDPDAFELLRAELPNGGARVRVPGAGEEAQLDDAGVAADPKATDTGGGAQHELPLTGAAHVYSTDDAGPTPPTEAEVLVLHLIAQPGDRIRGPELARVLAENGLEHGEMGIYHRRSGPTLARQELRFSLANMFEPGTIDAEHIEDFSTEGLTLFMALPGPREPLQAFREMHRVAEQLRAKLHLELLDDGRSTLTPQTLEHYRERIRDFKLHHLARH